MWEILANYILPILLALVGITLVAGLMTAMYKMRRIYGGQHSVSSQSGVDIQPTCYGYVDAVLDIPSYEPEFFKTVHNDIKTFNKDCISIQSTHFMGVMLQGLVNQFFL